MITIRGYTVGAEIGRGGMSVVYEAVHDLLKTRHAVKVLDVPTDSENGKTLAAKFLAEARILATLRHPNIIRVTDFGTLEDGRVYFVMDHVEGGSLAERLASGDPPSTSAVHAWYAELRSAIALCHQHGIVHGDIKPENVLVDGDGRLILSDFGIARLTDHTFRADLDLATSTLPGNFGTPYTLAPECRHGGKATPAADVYSFGVLLFKCLTGLWFEGSPRLLQEIDAAFPEWSPILHKMLAREASDRSASANDLPNAAPEQSTEIASETASRPTPSSDPTRRQPFRQTVINWFIGSVATLSILSVLNYIWKCLYLYCRHGGFPNGIPSFF